MWGKQMRKLMTLRVGAVLACFVPTALISANCEPLNPIPESEWKKINSEEKTRLADLDGDGVKENIRFIASVGSGFSSNEVQTKLSQSGTKIAISHGGSYGDFFSVSGIPGYLEGEENKTLRRKIERMLFSVRCKTFDPSAFKLLVRSKTVWHDGKPGMPDTYTVLVGKDEFPGLFRKYKIKENTAWVSYYGHNHARSRSAHMGSSKFRLLFESGRYQLLGTAHGVVRYDKSRNKHTWEYVFPGGRKLRWPSVIGARIDKNDKVKVRLYKPRQF
jgi:hypothetical protein